MKRRVCLSLSLSFFSILICLAQEFPTYGTVTSGEINLKQCAFDKDADAVVLLHEAYADHDEQYRLITTHHVKIKILSEKGFSFADVLIPFYRKDNFEQIDKVEGMTINVGENNQVEKIRLERKSIFTQNENERIGKVVFTFPAIKVGSIIDYQFRSTMKHYGGLDDWAFQKKIPVITSKFKLVILPNTEFAYRVNNVSDLPLKIKKEASTGAVNFEMENIPALEDEPYMDARSDYLHRVIFQLSGYNMGNGNSKKYMTSWEEVTKELLTSLEFGVQIQRNIPSANDFIKQTNALESEEEKMMAVLDFVRSNMTWNGLYSKYSQGGVKDTWQKKSGNNGEINLLLVNLLREASLKSYPILVSERSHGKVNISYPFIDQFSSVLACVFIGNKKFYLDATDKSFPAHLIPLNILNTTAFIVDRKAG
ncbi:MAG: DUF3857 domain-containing protein, partial [Gloeobacteraceae cyanobacterium ES-bin-316]|nr:DUF3857 domain-containing protein [Ferruginibacter sp.]